MITIDSCCNREGVLRALKRELGAVEIPTDDPRLQGFQELLEKQTAGTLSFEEREQLNRLYKRASKLAGVAIPR